MLFFLWGLRHHIFSTCAQASSTFIFILRPAWAPGQFVLHNYFSVEYHRNLMQKYMLYITTNAAQ